MSNKTLTISSLLIILCMAALFAAQFVPTLWVIETQTYATYNGTKGVSIEHQSLPWTLNFDQQNALISALNAGESIVPGLVKKNTEKFHFGKVTIYQFNKPDIVLTPVSMIDGDIVFQSDQVTETGFLKEGSGGSLMQILSQAFDK